MKNFKKKQLALSTLVALACAGHIGYAADPATTTTTENGVTNNYWDITINNIKEDSGLELGTNSRARGNGSIATGTGSLAVGNNAVATGGNETKDTITGKLNENKQRLAQIATAQNNVTNLANEIQKIRAEQAKAIEAGERVKQVRLAKEKAHQDYLNRQNAWSTEVANSAEFLRNAQAKLDDLNNRLGAVNRLGGVDINSEDGLTAAAANLKRMTEEGSTLDLPLDSFYKEYIKAHYKAMGDLRINNIKKGYYNHYYDARWSDYAEPNGWSEATNPVNLYYFTLANGIRKTINYNNRFYADTTNAKVLSSNAFDPSITITNRPTKNILLKDYNTDISTEQEWNDAKEQAPKFKQSFKEYILGNNSPFLTSDIKEKLSIEFNKKVDYYVKSIEITYYQKQYEDTHNTVWLDKKNTAIKEFKNIEASDQGWTTVKEMEKLYKVWEKENINDIAEKNKITTNKLTSDLETALKINKNAVAEKEKQIAALKASADQAKTNWESINPNASDLLYMEQYEALMRQLTAKSQELQQNQERLTALKNALTLHDLTNVGENAMAIGTNSLSTGSNSIAIGTGTIVTGENSISIGKGSAVTGTNSIAVGVGHIVIGNNSGTFGDPNTIYGDNSYAFGNNNTIGDATTTHTVGTNTFVLGSNVTTKANNSVVLGKDSTATEDNVVSIGSSTATRKLINVTDGSVAENSKEGITGNQLWKVAEAKDGAINKASWQAALGTGTNAAGNTGLITGDTLHAALANVQIDPSTLTSKANTNASNITSDDVKKWSEKLGVGTVTDGNTGLVTGGTVNTAITNAINNATSNINNGLDSKFNAKANTNASNITSDDAKKWSEKLGVGTVGQGESSNGLVNGKAVYEAIEKYSPKGLVKTDGKTVTVDKAGKATHIDFSGTDEHGNSILRDITGVVTNPNDPTSVVNMDTLQSQSQGLDQKLTKAINVGTATASALAALHPLDYDEANKVSFSVSHGQYNGSKATAFGGFVRPNENIMLSLASTISSNDRAWNAGLSFKIGSGSSHKKINQNDFVALQNKNDKLENELNQLKEQLSKLSTRLSPKRASFPDVPKDHWAKEAVETLHGNDVLDGYPDGEFKGDKQLTRYEYAQMLYKGLK